MEKDRDIMVGGKYRHFKGKEYKVLHIVKHSETLEPMVVYQALYEEGELWVRPLAMFLDDKELDGHKVPRFAYLK